MLRKFTVKWRNHINDILSFWAVYGNERSGGVGMGVGRLGVGEGVVNGTLLQSSIYINYIILFLDLDRFEFMVFNATFNNISAILCKWV